jgi:hypothetical protein
MFSIPRKELAMSQSLPLPLTPSELVFFHGEEFAKRVLMGNITLVHSEAKVSAADLGRAMLAAAVLGAEQGGSIRLEVRSKKGFLGLGKTDSLYVEPTEAAVAWPEPSLEADIVRLAPMWRARKGQNDVFNVIYGVLGEDSVNPCQSLGDKIKARLASRGVLRGIEERKLKVLVSTRYELPEDTAAQLLRQPLAPVQQLLDGCRRDRPQVWKLLQSQIGTAISLRTERVTNDSDD